MANKSYNDSMGQSHEVSEGEDLKKNRRKAKGHAEDSRFDAGLKGKEAEDVRTTRPSDHFSAKVGRKYLGHFDKKEFINQGHNLTPIVLGSPRFTGGALPSPGLTAGPKPAATPIEVTRGAGRPLPAASAAQDRSITAGPGPAVAIPRPGVAGRATGTPGVGATLTGGRITPSRGRKVRRGFRGGAIGSGRGGLY